MAKVPVEGTNWKSQEGSRDGIHIRLECGKPLPSRDAVRS